MFSCTPNFFFKFIWLWIKNDSWNGYIFNLFNITFNKYVLFIIVSRLFYLTSVYFRFSYFFLLLTWPVCFIIDTLRRLAMVKLHLRGHFHVICSTVILFPSFSHIFCKGKFMNVSGLTVLSVAFIWMSIARSSFCLACKYLWMKAINCVNPGLWRIINVRRNSSIS